jgi:hypothetical protein
VISNETLAVFDMEGHNGRVVLRVDGFEDLDLGMRHQLAAARAHIDFWSAFGRTSVSSVHHWTGSSRP